MQASATKSTEIIAIASGKGGTGKTLIAASLGYALKRAGHRVLMIDTDTGTDGLSLFLLGPKGVETVERFEEVSTFRGILLGSASNRSSKSAPGPVEYSPRTIYRDIEQIGSPRASDAASAASAASAAESSSTPATRATTGSRIKVNDHGMRYEAIISGKGLYGDDPSSGRSHEIVACLDRQGFRSVVKELFDRIRREQEFDYVIVDTRGGFGFESSDVCAIADSFIMVTDPDYTSFHQDRNLVKRVSAAADELQTRSMLRAIIVNRAIEREEKQFRLALELEFKIKYSDTHAVPPDLQAMMAYRTQQMPYVYDPGCVYAQATLRAFSDIFSLTTSRWDPARVDGWNALVSEVTAAVKDRDQTRGKRRLLPWFVMAALAVSTLLALIFLLLYVQQRGEVAEMRDDARQARDRTERAERRVDELSARLQELLLRELGKDDPRVRPESRRLPSTGPIQAP